MNNNYKYNNLSVLIVEDDTNSRETLKSMLELDFKHVYEAKDGCEGLELYKKLKPEIIITDIQMPLMDGLAMLNEIKKISPNAFSIFISAFSEVNILLNAIDLKVDAYIIKPFQYKDLLEKIDTKLSVSEDNSHIYKTLSTRELEVFIDMAKGIKPNDIASKYSVKPKTIGTYRRRILDKLNLNNNAELVTYAINHQLI